MFNKLKCKNCNNVDDIWLCLTCSNVGCGRYHKRHAQMHSSLFNHYYCINMKTKKIWNYILDTYIEERVHKNLEDITTMHSENSYDEFNKNKSNKIHSDNKNKSKKKMIPNNYHNNRSYYNIHTNEKKKKQKKNFHLLYYDNNYIDDFSIFDQEYPLCDYNKKIYYKIYDIFTNDIYINDNLKNELLYILYSQLSHESNIYNNILIELQYIYLNKLEHPKNIMKNVTEKIMELQIQNNKINLLCTHLASSIKKNNNLKNSLQEKIKFYRNINNNIILHKKNNNFNNSSNKNRNKEKMDDKDIKKIHNLDQTIKQLQEQVDALLTNL
ncbi:hypothetical protein PFMALIP_01837 [Plasmodium falciparum MaliPS096_E11]|nr:hypothetical protein PFMALIP_01837 [Plasmodium falciparum MaliPS096_E11]